MRFLQTVSLVLLFTLNSVAAQTDADNNTEVIVDSSIPSLVETSIEPRMNVPISVEVNETFTLDATNTRLKSPSSGQATYNWDTGDDNILWGIKTKHEYANPGRYELTLSVKQGNEREYLSQEIIVYTRQGVLITDVPRPNVIEQAAQTGVWLTEIVYEKADTPLATEESFNAVLGNNVREISNADAILFWNDTPTAIQSFAQWMNGVAEENSIQIDEKSWVYLTEGSINTIQQQIRTAGRTFNAPGIILTRPEATPTLWEYNDPAAIGSILVGRGIEYTFVDDRTNKGSWKILSNLISYFVQNGVSQNVLYLLLSVPFLAFVVAFFRQFVGIKTYGVYTPMMLGLSFLVLGLWVGLLAFITVLVVSSIVRWLFSKVELLYIPKVALTLSMLSLSFLLVVWIGIELNLEISWGLAVFPMLVMATVSEKFLSNQSSSGLISALVNTSETLGVALVGWLLVSWGFVEQSILSMPELVILPLLGSYWLGKFSGLRLSEYFKFRAFFQETSE